MSAITSFSCFIIVFSSAKVTLRSDVTSCGVTVTSLIQNILTIYLTGKVEVKSDR